MAMSNTLLMQSLMQSFPCILSFFLLCTRRGEEEEDKVEILEIWNDKEESIKKFGDFKLNFGHFQ